MMIGGINKVIYATATLAKQLGYYDKAGVDVYPIDAPAGVDPSVGDIAYYAPWGNLAIFYKDFGYSRGLIGLGRIDSGIEALRVPGSLKVTIERVGKRSRRPSRTSCGRSIG